VCGSLKPSTTGVAIWNWRLLRISFSVGMGSFAQFFYRGLTLIKLQRIGEN
jgi:hypothetical protein